MAFYNEGFSVSFACVVGDSGIGQQVFSGDSQACNFDVTVDYPVEYFLQRPYRYALQYARDVVKPRRVRLGCQTWAQFLAEAAIPVKREGYSRPKAEKVVEPLSPGFVRVTKRKTFKTRPVPAPLLSREDMHHPAIGEIVSIAAKASATSVKQVKRRFDKVSFHTSSQEMMEPRVGMEETRVPRCQRLLALCRYFKEQSKEGMVAACLYMLLKHKFKEEQVEALDYFNQLQELEGLADVSEESPESQADSEGETVSADFLSPKDQADSKGEDVVTDIDQRGNVALTSQRGSSGSDPPIQARKGFLQESSATEQQTLDQLTDRWIEVDSFQWATSHTPDVNIKTYRLPLDCLSKNTSSPNFQPFRVHQYGRFDLDIRIQVNSNKFQVGQLQCSWMYAETLNQRMAIWDNPYSASQRTHGLVTAGSSNDVVLHIPYWSLPSLIYLKDSKNHSKQNGIVLDLGTLTIKVLNQLRATSGVSQEASVTVWMAVSNPEFRGMKDANLDKPFEQMDVIGETVKTAEKLLPVLGSIFNADNPPAHTNSVSFQPTASHSFGVTDGQVERVRVMRANPLNQTPRVPGSVPQDMELKALLQKWSLIKRVTWSDSNERGSSLFALYSSPSTFGSPSAIMDGAVVQVPSIVAFLSSMFGFWSGELEIRVDVIANQFYSGRFGLYTIPSTEEAIPSFDIARNSAGMIFDLQDTLSFVYKIPYYANTPMWPVYSSLTGEDRYHTWPSMTVAYVVNRLTRPDNVSATIDMNVYVRASPTFDLAVLKTPDSAAFLNSTIIKKQSADASVSPSWAQAFVSTSRRFYSSSKKLYYSSLFYNETTDYFTQFDNLKFTDMDGSVKKKVYYQVPLSQKIGDLYYRIAFLCYTTKWIDVRYFARAQQYSEYPVVVLFSSEEDCKKYLGSYNIEWSLSSSKQGPWAIYCVDKDQAKVESAKLPEDPYNPKGGWSQVSAAAMPNYKFPQIFFDNGKKLVEEFEDLGNHIDMLRLPAEQMDEIGTTVSAVVSLDSPSAPTSYGSKLFGESITDVKSICRRWQTLGCVTITTESGSNCLQKSRPKVVVSTHPIKKINPRLVARDNALREGMISNIASMYAGYRGSMRYRVIISDQSMDTPVSLMVVHKFNQVARPQLPSVSPDGGSFATNNTYLDTSYAAEFQATGVNPVLEFEIPFYNRGEYNLLYTPPIAYERVLESYYQSGEIWIYISSVKQITLACEVFYSVADDFEFSMFQGVPACISLEPLGQSNEEGETIKVMAQDQGITDSIRSVCSTVKDTVMAPANVSSAAQKVGAMADTVRSVVSNTTSKVSNTFSSIVDGFKALVSKIPAMTSIGELAGWLSTQTTNIFLVVLQLLWVILSPSVISISLCIGAILSTVFFGVNPGQLAWEKIIECFSQIFQFNIPLPKQQSQEDDANFVAKGVSLLWSTILGIFCLKNKDNSSTDKFANNLFKISGDTFRVHSFGVRFISDFIICLKRMFLTVSEMFGEKYPILSLIESSELKAWAIESLVILDVNNKDLIMKNVHWQAKLNELHVKGSVLCTAARLSSSVLSNAAIAYIESLKKKLDDKVQMLNQTNTYAPFRPEPFVLWLYSTKAGTGKSTKAEYMCCEIAKRFKIAPHYFKLTPGNVYFDSLTTQKIIMLDDFLATTSPNAAETYAQYLQMVGCSQTSFPRAKLENKETFDSFEFVIVTSNFANFDAENVCKVKEPYNRRRNLVIEFTGTCLNPSYVVHDPITNKVIANIEPSKFEEYVLEAMEQQRKLAADLHMKKMAKFNEALGVAEKETSFEAYLEKFKDELARQGCLEAGDSWFKTLKTKLCEFFKPKPVVSINPDVEEDNTQVVNEPSLSPVEQGDNEGVARAQSIALSIDECEEEIASYTTMLKTMDEDDLSKPTILSGLDTAKRRLQELRLLKSGAEKVVLVNLESSPDQTAQLNKLVDKEIGLDLLKPNVVFGTPPRVVINYALDKDQCCFNGRSVECSVEVMKAPHWYAVDREAFKRELDASDALSKETKDAWLFCSMEGVFCQMTPDGYQFSWVMCPCKKKHVMGTTRHVGIESACFLAGSTNTKQAFEYAELRKCYPTGMWHLLNMQLNQESGLVALDNPSLFQPIKQFLNLWPKTVRIGKTIHPLLNDDSTPVVREIETPTWKDSFRKFIGAEPITLQSGEAAWRYPKWVTWLEVLALALSVIMMIRTSLKVFLGLSFFSSLLGMGYLQQPVCQMNTSGSIAQAKQKPTTSVQARSLLKPSSQSLSEGEIESLASTVPCGPINDLARLKKVLRNTCFLVCKSDFRQEKGEWVCNLTKHRCLGLYNNKFLGCRHYLKGMKDRLMRFPDAQFFLVRLDGDFKPTIIKPLNLSQIEVFEFGINGKSQGDLCIFDVGKQVSQFKDIRRFMPTSGIEYYASNSVIVEQAFGPGIAFNQKHVTFSNRSIEINAGTKDVWEIGPHFEYAIGGPGMCGSLVWNEKSAVPLIGFHTAGIHTSIGYAEPLLRDEYNFSDIVVESGLAQMDSVGEEVPNFGFSVPVGRLTNSMKPHVPTVSKIIPSLAHGILPLHTEPAPLNHNDSRLESPEDPLIAGFAKRGDPMVPFNKKDVELVQESLVTKLIANCKPVLAPVKKLSFIEAVEGISEIPYCDSLVFSTSEGYPWVKMRPENCKDKRWLFDLELVETGYKCKSIIPELQEILELKESMRKRGFVPCSYYTAMLKDARIGKSKVHIVGKTRVFEMSPIDLTIAQRQLMLPFCASYMENRFDCENTIGINVNGVEWSRLHGELVNFSPYILAGDYSSYGPKIELNVLNAAIDCIGLWTEHYSQVFDRVEFETLKHEIMLSPVVVGKFVVLPAAGMASGNASTVIFNSLVNSFYIRLAYLEIMREVRPQIADMKSFSEYVKMYSNGDDVIISVKEAIIDVFNNASLQDCFAKHNLKYTNSKKDMEMVPYEDISEVQYLKCMFVAHPFRVGAMLAALDINSIEDCPQWIWKTDRDQLLATLENCEQAVRLSYGHGPLVFNTIRQTVLKWVRSNEYFLELPTWDQLDRLVWDCNEVIVN